MTKAADKPSQKVKPSPYRHPTLPRILNRRRGPDLQVKRKDFELWVRIPFAIAAHPSLTQDTAKWATTPGGEEYSISDFELNRTERKRSKPPTHVWRVL